MVAVIKKQIENIEGREKQFFWLGLSMLIVILLSYGILVSRTISNALARENIQKEMSVLSSDVGLLEFEYLNLKNSVTMNLAKSYGFISARSEHFAQVQTPQTLSLSVKR